MILVSHYNAPNFLDDLISPTILYKKRFCNKKDHYKFIFIYFYPRTSTTVVRQLIGFLFTKKHTSIGNAGFSLSYPECCNGFYLSQNMVVKMRLLANKYNNNTILRLQTRILGQPETLLGNNFILPHSISE